MKALWLLLAMAIPLQPICSQEVHYAPTVEQCRADQTLWVSKLSDAAKAEEAEGLRESRPVASAATAGGFLQVHHRRCATITDLLLTSFVPLAYLSIGLRFVTDCR